MTTEVGLQKDGEIAVITVDNPPVNALKQVVRAGLLSTLTQARDDAATRAIVLVARVALSSPAPTSPSSASRRSRRACPSSSGLSRIRRSR